MFRSLELSLEQPDTHSKNLSRFGFQIPAIGTLIRREDCQRINCAESWNKTRQNHSLFRVDIKQGVDGFLSSEGCLFNISAAHGEHFFWTGQHGSVNACRHPILEGGTVIDNARKAVEHSNPFER